MAIKWGRATTEFVVVVVGVAVGLAADGWRQDLIERRDELSILQRLEADLLADSAQLAFGQERLVIKLDPLRRLVDLDTVTVAIASEVAADVTAASSYTWNVPSSNSSTFDELVSTGRLDLVRESSVRAELSRYYKLYADLISTIDRRRTRFGPFSYEAVRRAEVGSGGGSDFEAAELTAREVRRLTTPRLVEELRIVSTAELSATGWSLSRLSLLEDRNAALLERLRVYSD